jgi:hypothetical protein
LQEGGGDEQHLDERELAADADARPGPEREVGVLRDRLGAFGREASGVELFGVGEEARVALSDEGDQLDVMAPLQRVAADLDFARGLAREDADGRRVQS